MTLLGAYGRLTETASSTLPVNPVGVLFPRAAGPGSIPETHAFANLDELRPLEHGVLVDVA
jgi:hypothetical protein